MTQALEKTKHFGWYNKHPYPELLPLEERALNNKQLIRLRIGQLLDEIKDVHDVMMEFRVQEDQEDMERDAQYFLANRGDYASK